MVEGVGRDPGWQCLVATDPELSAAQRRRLGRHERHLPARGGVADLPSRRAVFGPGGVVAVVIGVGAVVCSVLCIQGVIGARWLSLLSGLVLGGSVGAVVDRIERGQVINRCQDRFLVETDLEETELALLKRADAAIQEVRGSQVVTDAVIDDVEVGVTLREQYWAIAQDLARQCVLRRRMTAAADEGGDRTGAAVRDLRIALNRGHAESWNEVERLERYAERVRAVDATYQDWRRAHELRADLDDECVEILAGTARTAARAADIEALTERARALARSLDADVSPTLATRQPA